MKSNLEDFNNRYKLANLSKDIDGMTDGRTDGSIDYRILFIIFKSLADSLLIVDCCLLIEC